VHRFIARLTRSLLISDLAQLGGAIGSHGCRSASSVLVGWRHCHGCRSAPSAQRRFARGALLGRLRIAWSAHHPGILDAVTAVVSASSVLPCACPVVGRVHDSVHVTAVVLLRQRRVPAPSSGGSMTLHLSRLPFCSVSPAVASGGVAGSTVHAIFVAAPSLPTTPAFGCCTAVVLLRQSCPVVGRAHDTSRLSFCFVSPAARLPRRRAGP
jgi:hypothetical protein